MSRLSFLLLIPSVAATLGAQAAPSGASGLRPAPSGRAMTEVRLSMPQPANATPATPGVTPPKPLVISIDYGQPHLRGRALHTDSLVPYDKPWRLGANEATTLTTDVDLVLGGVNVPKGKYVLLAVPGRKAWTLIVQKDAGQSVTNHDAKHDVARVNLAHQELSAPVESLTMWLVPSTKPGPASGELVIAWGRDRVSAPWVVAQ